MPTPRRMHNRGLPSPEQRALDRRHQQQQVMKSHFGSGNSKVKVTERSKMHARQAQEERQQTSPSPSNEILSRQSIHKSLATAISNNLAAIKNADAIRAGDHLLSNFSSAASNQQPGTQWTGLPGGELKFPEVPSVASQPPVTMQQVS